MLTWDIQNSSVAKDVSSYSIPLLLLQHCLSFVLNTKIHLLPFCSAYTWMLSLQLST